jgi:hypothetical protein
MLARVSRLPDRPPGLVDAHPSSITLPPAEAGQRLSKPVLMLSVRFGGEAQQCQQPGLSREGVVGAVDETLGEMALQGNGVFVRSLPGLGEHELGFVLAER